MIWGNESLNAGRGQSSTSRSLSHIFPTPTASEQQQVQVHEAINIIIQVTVAFQDQTVANLYS